MSQEQSELERIECQIEEICRKAYSLRNNTYEPIGLRGLSDHIMYAESKGFIHKGQTVLDMGAGGGSSSILWGHHRYNVIGIELQPKLAEFSQEAIRKCQEPGIIKEGIEVKIYPGNYFPAEYSDKRKGGKSTAFELENALSGCSFFTNQPADHLFFPPIQEDVYRKHNINLKNIDVFYAYAWPVQTPSVIEIFNDHAHDGATLCIISPMIDEADDYIKELGLISFKRPGNSWTRYIQKAPVQKSIL